VLAVSARARLGALAARAIGFEHRLDALRAQLGGMESRLLRDPAPANLRDAEFRVFSQFGEDGIIQFLTQRIAIDNEVFVEFGVEDYSESNTRFLLVNNNWRGLVMDGGDAHVAFMRRTGLDWRHDVQAKRAFVDRDNVVDLITGAGISGDIGLLSIDIDGNDYWVLEAIEGISPRILVVEYNSNFGPEAAVTVPYDAAFERSKAHWSHLYWGASLAALDRMARQKGYALVGGNRAGNNAFWIREDVLGGLSRVSVSDAYAPSRFRESRSRSGELTYVSAMRDRLSVIRDLPLIDLDGGPVTVADRFGV
jgi:hypothetical protein